MNKLAVDIGKEFGSPLGTQDVGTIVSLVIRVSFLVAGILILFFLVFAGIQMIAGAGQDNPEAAGKAQKAATYAVVGFAIIFVAYWIIRIVELMTGIPFITNPGF